jgi:hypothetical protein
MTFAEQQAFYEDVARAHPVQRDWNEEACWRFLSERLPAEVVELGGWDGSLAAAMLDRAPFIRWWSNYDIVAVPQVCTDRRYGLVVPDEPAWQGLAPIPADALIASHVVEHLRVAEVEALVSAWAPRSIYLDTPLEARATDWRGYEGSHVIEVGSEELLARLDALGYTATHTEGQMIAFLDRR